MSNELAKYITIRPQSFEPNRIMAYLDALDKKYVNAEIDYDNVKDQVQEVFDYVVNEKMSNESITATLAKTKASNDDRYKKVKKELSDRKKIYLYCKVESKIAHSYCENLKTQSINNIATEKLIKN
tara:strand:- start:898 stop:1275 length:378 start_codon:yes stop_codon:yes gene_type:complete